MTYEKTDAIRTFLQEKLYLQNVSPKTIVLYESCFKAFDGAIESLEVVKERVVKLRERGVSPVTVNTYLRHIKCFYLWQGKEWKIPWLKEEQKVLVTLSSSQITNLLCKLPQCGKVKLNLWRAYLIALTILDCGLRANEVLSLTREDCDFENLVFKVKGKGGKHRVVPFSIELRKHIFRFVSNNPHAFLYGTKNHTQVSVRNLERDFKSLGKCLGITGVRFSPHTLRHTMATSWIRRGGDLFQLSKMLGHSSITTTQLYLKSLGIEDLAVTHSRVSLLSR